MPSVDIIDEMFVVASPAATRAILCDEVRWREWFPGLTLTAYDDRGLLGVRWNVTGDLQGTAEVWLEECGDGTIVHTYLRAEPVPTPRRRKPWQLERLARRRYALPLKRRLVAVKDALEVGHEPGLPRVPLSQRVVSPPITNATPPRRTTAESRAEEGDTRNGRPDDVEHPDLG